jgi:hypothetical protein
MSGENINKFYHPFALVCNEEDLQLLITILRSIRVISFSFVVDDRKLNDVPMWVALGIIPETGSNEGRRKSLNVSVCFVIYNAVFIILLLYQVTSPPHIVSSGASSSSSSGSGGGASALKSPPSDSSFFGSLSWDVTDLFMQAAKYLAPEELETADGDRSRIRRNLTQSAIEGDIPRPIQQKKRVPLFGSSLLQLVMDEERTVAAYLDPRVGIPTQALKMINAIHEKINTPGLFRNKGDPKSIAKLVAAIENEDAFPSGIDVHSIAQCFLQWLYSLPEPLLGYEHFDAIIACAEGVELDADRIRNLSIVVKESPWYAQPLLSKVMALFAACFHKSHGNNSILSNALQ